MVGRYYDPSTDQFLSVDPDVAETGQPYAFTGDDPLNATDPLGLCWSPVGCGLLKRATKDLRSARHKVAHAADKVRHFAAAHKKELATVGVFIATIPLDETGAGEAIDTEAVTADVASDAADDAADDVASCGGQSFTPGTDVQLANGAKLPISKVRVGDMVLATDTATGKTKAERVTALWVNHDADLMDVTVRTSSGISAIKSTQHHLFWDLSTHRWVQAEDLSAGTALQTPTGTTATVVATTMVPGTAYMWDLTVNNDHDFYVSVGAGSQTAVLVHTCGDGPMDHIMERHGPGTEGNGAGTFSQGTSRDDIQSMIDDTVQNGASRANTGGRAGQIFEQTFGSPIGTNGGGAVSSSLRVVLNGRGGLTTAFPY